MARSTSRVAAVLAVSTALMLTACTTSPGTESNDGEPQSGGTLKVLANGDVDHLDPQLVAYVPTYSVMRSVSRSLLSYAASDDAAERIVLQPDLVEEVSTPSADGLTYTVTLRDGVTWGAPDGARPRLPGGQGRSAVPGGTG